MNKQTILKHINNGGATLSNKTMRAVNFQNGYMVSLPKHEKVYNAKSVKFIERYLNKIQAKAQELNAYVGLWVNNGKLYIDLSQNIKDLHKAAEVGTNAKQYAVWDCENKRAINLCI